MPTFQYTSLGKDNSPGAVIDAPDRAAAVRSLRQKGITPTRVEEISSRESAKSSPAMDAEFEAPRKPAAPDAPAPAPQIQVSGAMSRAEMATFIRELATATQAGLPLVPALRTILRQHRNPRQRAVISKLIAAVEQGKPLADSAAAIGKPFTELIISMLRAGEMSGRLSEVLEQTANLQDRDIKTRRTMIAGLIYPAILALLVIGALTVISTFIVPRILATFAKLGSAQLPWPTRVVMGFTHFMGQYWWVVILIIVASIVLLRAAYQQASSRLSIDRFLMKIPLLGTVLRDVAVARFTRTLGTLVAAGLPALTALRITKSVLGNKAMEQTVEQVCDKVASGKTISDELERSGYFPPLLTQIVGLGERSGRLHQMLHQAANVFEERTENSIKIFTAAFPPVMVVIAACIVGFVVAAVILPMVQMQDLIG